MRLRRRRLLIPAVLALLALAVSFAFSGRGTATEAAATEVRFGQSVSLNGPHDAQGQALSAGVRAALERRNRLGGIHRLRLELETRNDAYQPDRATQAARELIEGRDVLLLFGGLGAPSGRAVARVTEEVGVPLVGPATGASYLYRGDLQGVVRIRPDCAAEMERLVAWLVDRRGLTEIACFYETHDYGRMCRKALDMALRKRGLTPAAEGMVQRNTTSVIEALTSIGDAEPEAIVMIASARATAAFARSARRTVQMQDAILCAESTTDADVVVERLGRDADGIAFTRVVPMPTDDSLPIVQRFTRDMHELGEEERIGWTALEGYVAGELVCQVLESLSPDPTREEFLAALTEIGTFDLGGFELRFTPDDLTGSDRVYLVEFRDGAFRPLH